MGERMNEWRVEWKGGVRVMGQVRGACPYGCGEGEGGDSHVGAGF
jgi:hypothetical protein